MSGNLDNLRPAGRIVRTHGLNGNLRVASDYELSEILPAGVPVFVQMAQGPVPFFVRSIGPVGNGYAIELDWISTLDEANKLVGRDILLDQNLLTEDQDDLDELIGFAVSDIHHGPLGPVTEISHTAAHPIMHIDFNGKEILIPIVDELIAQFDDEARLITIDAPQGLIDLYLNG